MYNFIFNFNRLLHDSLFVSYIFKYLHMYNHCTLYASDVKTLIKLLSFLTSCGNKWPGLALLILCISSGAGIFKLCRQVSLHGKFREVTYTIKWPTPSLNACGSIVSIGLSDNILEQ